MNTRNAFAKGTPLWSIEQTSKFGLVEDTIIAFGLNQVTCELLTATQDCLRLYNLIENCLVADFVIPQAIFQDQKKPAFRVKLIEPLIFAPGWLVVTTKKQLIFYSKNLICSKPIELKDQPEMLIPNQREEDFYIVGADRRKLRSFCLNLSSELESVDASDQIIMYNSMIAALPGYHKRREKIAEIQEKKSLTVQLCKSKSLITCKFPIIMAKINEDLGLIAISTQYHEIIVYNTTTSDRIAILQDALDKSTNPSMHNVFLYPVLDWQQEMLLVMDDVARDNRSAVSASSTFPAATRTTEASRRSCSRRSTADSSSW